MIYILLLSLFTLFSCSSPTSSSIHNPPADHTINIGGALHKSGLRDPLKNCSSSSCHGSDLKGGTAKVSCYQCHGRKW